MKLLDYIKDQIVLILLYFTMILLVQFFLVMYHLPATLKVSLLIIMILFLLIVISYDYYRKSFFYQDFQKKLDQLDKKCLISALITRPNFLEGQILYDSSNSIKYHGESDCLISFNVIQNKNHISLEILDNGIGIKDSELPYVFDKSFTGENGRLVSSATGMGLYIVKNLCHKLGHQIAIESKQGKYTKVIIDFNNEDYYKVVR